MTKTVPYKPTFSMGCRVREDNFHSATARNIEEPKELVESGFSYVCDIEGVKLFRKRM